MDFADLKSFEWWVEFCICATGIDILPTTTRGSNIPPNGVGKIATISFCTASETRLDTVDLFIKTPVGSFNNHKFNPYTEVALSFAVLSETRLQSNYLKYLMEF